MAIFLIGYRGKGSGSTCELIVDECDLLVECLIARLFMWLCVVIIAVGY